MNLTELITAATTGTAPVKLGAAVALYAIAADDHRTMGLNLAPTTGNMDVTIDLDDDGEFAEAHVQGSLRYLIDLTSDTATRLCTVPGCNGESNGRHLATRNCANHIDIPYLGNDAAESRRIRLDAWEEEAREAGKTPAGDLLVIADLRKFQA